MESSSSNFKIRRPLHAWGPTPWGYGGSVWCFCICDTKTRERLARRITPNTLPPIAMFLTIINLAIACSCFFCATPHNGRHCLDRTCACQLGRLGHHTHRRKSSCVIIIIQLLSIVSCFSTRADTIRSPSLSRNSRLIRPGEHAQRHPRGPQSGSEDDCEEADHT
jgi:hypothetical protein